MDRFRPNIVVSGADLAAWAEDTWQSIRVGGAGGFGATFSLVKPCDRCKVPRINQQTAEVGDSQPTDMLHKLRGGKVLGWTDPPTFKHSVFFAWNLTTLDAGAALTVGDAVNVLTERSGAPARNAAGT